MKNGDKVVLRDGEFKGLIGTVYTDDNGNYEIYIEETENHSGFYVYCTEEGFTPNK